MLVRIRSFFKKLLQWRPNWIVWVRDVVILILLLIVVDFWQRRNLIEPGQTIDWPIEDVHSLTGESVTLDMTKPTLLYFWAPWCGVCRYTIPKLHALAEGYKDRIQIFPIALDFAESESVEAFREEHNVQFPLYLGTDNLRDLFRVVAYPTYYILNEKNQVMTHKVGYGPHWLLKLQIWRNLK